MNKIQLFAYLVGVVTLGATPFAAIAETITTRSGNLSATLSFEREDYGGKNFRLKIQRSSQTVFDQPLPETDGSTVPYKEKALQILDLDGDQEPEVLVDLFTGGAHCCFYSLIHNYQPQQNTYRAIQQAWRDVGYKLEYNKNGLAEFHSADARFAYAFASFAASGFPLQIWEYHQGKMIDVTRRYPKLIRNNAYFLWQTYQQSRKNGYEVKGLLAAYLADKYSLGEAADGWQRLRSTYQAGDRQAYFSQLQKFLRETGYDR